MGFLKTLFVCRPVSACKQVPVLVIQKLLKKKKNSSHNISYYSSSVTYWKLCFQFVLLKNMFWEAAGFKRRIAVGIRMENTVPWFTLLENKLKSQWGTDSCVRLFKTHAAFLTALPAKCLAQQCGSETVGALWLSVLTPNYSKWASLS